MMCNTRSACGGDTGNGGDSGSGGDDDDYSNSDDNDDSNKGPTNWAGKILKELPTPCMTRTCLHRYLVVVVVMVMMAVW